MPNSPFSGLSTIRGRLFASLIAAAATGSVAAKAAPAELPDVTTVRVAPQTIKDSLFYPARLEERTVDVLSPLEGVIASTQKEMGEPVARGATLAMISNDNPAFSDQAQPLLAPIAGVVQSWVVHQGERVQKASRVAVLAVGVNRLVVELTGADGGKVKTGQKALFTPAGDDPKEPGVKGTVSAVSPTIDPVTNTRRCEITLSSQGLPASGSVGTAVIETAPHQGILVSLAAVQGPEKSRFVYVVKDGKAAARPVTLGSKHNGEVEVRSGLEHGDLLIIKTGAPLSEGQAVRVPGARQASTP